MSQINVDIIRSRTGTAATCDKGLVVSGVTTASGGVIGDVTGNVTGNASGTAGGLTGSPDITVNNINAGLSTFTNALVSCATFDSTAGDGPLLNIKRSGTNIGFVGSGKNLHDTTGSADALSVRSQAEFTVAAGGGTETVSYTHLTLPTIYSV